MRKYLITLGLVAVVAVLLYGQSNNWNAVNTNQQIVSTLATGTAPFSVASTTNVANLNASSLSGATFAAPGAIGGTTPAAGSFTGLTFTGSAPSLVTSGTTPYLNKNTLEKGTLNTCTFSLTVSTFTLALSPVSLCTYTLPNAALTWYWSCTLGYSMPAGTTPTFEPGVTWAQAPSAAFQIAQVYSTNTGTQTSLSTSTTTNSIIINGATSGPASTIFPANFSGTFTASATSGTFSPTVSLTGASATGTAVGGCTIQ